MEDSTFTSVTAGARKFLVADVAAVAVGGARIQLDPASLEKCKANAEEAAKKSRRDPKLAFVEGSAAAAAPPSYEMLPEEICRAAITVRIVSYLLGRAGVSPYSISLMADMLGAGVVPALPATGKEEGPFLLGALCGEGGCYTPTGIQPARKAMAAAGLVPLEKQCLSDAEKNSLALQSFAARGSAALSSAAAQNASLAVDGAAALACEVASICMEPFQAVHFDICRPHRGQMDSAESLRLLLEGSRRVHPSSKAGCSPLVAQCLWSAPQVHGPARDIISSAARSIELEINTCEAAPLASVASSPNGGAGSGCAFAYNQMQVHAAQRQLAEALEVLSQCSRSRLMVLEGAPQDGIPSQVRWGAEEGEEISSAQDEARALELTLAQELSLSLTMLASEEKEKASEEAAKQKAKDEASAKRELPAAAVAAKAASNAGDDGMTEAQRAKAEAKRRAKEEKAAAKAAAKAARKADAGGSSILGLAPGTSMLRTWLLAATGGDCSPEAIAIAIDLTRGDGGVGATISQELERLSSGGTRRNPKIPKGTRDQTPEQMVIREKAFGIIRRIFKRHGAVEIDTPVFELKETLTGKYGEDQKLIYDIADQGGELLALRYDLTVPFARYLAMHSTGNIKRFHMAKVYRRDQPNIARGRYREFYQCDFDIAGNFGLMVPDAEVLSVACEILSSLPIGEFEVKLNHRRLLDAILDICGCPAEKFRPICSAIDKLDKAPWEEVRREMIEEKGLAAAAADKIGTFVTFSGPPRQLWDQLTSERKFGDHADAAAAMAELDLLFTYMEAMDTLKFVSFDLSLARGLTYYTGLIYEAIVTDGTTKVGSIAAGGRYDGLVGMFSSSEEQTPCVGVSIGIERVFALMEARALAEGTHAAPRVAVYIASIGPDLLKTRMIVARKLWDANIGAEYSSAPNPKLKPQLTEVLERGIPFMVIFGEDEVSKGMVKIKCIDTHTEEEVSLEGLVPALLERSCPRVTDSAEDLARQLR
jgi:histidyl-tRNA synthetase